MSRRGVLDSGLVWEGSRWDGVTAIEESERHVFVRHKAHGTLIIPKRAFENAQRMQAFLDEVNRLRAQAAIACARPRQA